jgi:F0F1-type ATP synthase membrane subunit b/b'
VFNQCGKSIFEEKEIRMKRNRVVLGGMLSMALLFGGLVGAQVKPPAENVSGKRHPNLAAAQRHLEQAFDKIQAAQQANEFDLQGHARKAKELIDQASRELKEAAEASNREQKEHK